MASWYPAQNMELHIVFVELTKTSDTVNRKGLWKILHTFGCPEKLVPWPLVDYFMSQFLFADDWVGCSLDKRQRLLLL